MLGTSCLYADILDTESGGAATIILVNPTEEIVSFDNDVAITSFTATVTQGESVQTLHLTEIEYELVNPGEPSPAYIVSNVNITDPNQEGNWGSFPIVYEGGIVHTGNTIFNVVLGVMPGGYPNTFYIGPLQESILAVVLPADILPLATTPGSIDRNIEISDVVISDTLTGEVIATLDKVEMNRDNEVILERLDQIKEDTEKLSEIQKDVKWNRTLLYRVLNYIRKLFRLIREG